MPLKYIQEKNSWVWCDGSLSPIEEHKSAVVQNSLAQWGSIQEEATHFYGSISFFQYTM